MKTAALVPMFLIVYVLEGKRPFWASNRSCVNVFISSGFYDVKTIGPYRSAGRQFNYGLVYSSFLSKQTKLATGFFYTGDKFWNTSTLGNDKNPIAIRVLDMVMQAGTPLYSRGCLYLEGMFGLAPIMVLVGRDHFDTAKTFINPLTERVSRIPQLNTCISLNSSIRIWRKFYLHLGISKRFFMYRVFMGQKNHLPIATAQLGFVYYFWKHRVKKSPFSTRKD